MHLSIQLLPVMRDLLDLFCSLLLLLVILGYILDLGAIFFLSLLVRVFILVVILDFLIYWPKIL